MARLVLEPLRVSSNIVGTSFLRSRVGLAAALALTLATTAWARGGGGFGGGDHGGGSDGGHSEGRALGESHESGRFDGDGAPHHDHDGDNDRRDDDRDHHRRIFLDPPFDDYYYYYDCDPDSPYYDPEDCD